MCVGGCGGGVQFYGQIYNSIVLPGFISSKLQKFWGKVRAVLKEKAHESNILICHPYNWTGQLVTDVLWLFSIIKIISWLK